MTPSTNKSIILAIFGTIFISLGTLLCISWPTLVNRMMNKELSLSPTSKSFEIWKNSGNIPLYMEMYFFNWTNPEEIRTPGKKPTFVQLGPYTFLEKREKVNITFNPGNSTVSYRQRKTWYFDKTRSNGSLDDEVTQLNVVALSAVHKSRDWSYLMQISMAAVALSKVDSIYVTRTVDQLLFTGYSDPLIDMGQLTANMVDIPPFDKFGWFYLRNGSTDFDGYTNMATGHDDIMNIGILRNWNYKNTTNFYKSPCNRLEGSAGEFWPPGRNKDDITLFTADICRPLTYEYEGTAEHHGIRGNKYAIGDKTLGNNTKKCYPHEQAKYFEGAEEFIEMERNSNEFFNESKESGETDVFNVGKCFCSGECTPSGIINVTACRYGAPAFVSLPHFHKADPIYRQQIEGLNPVDDKHGFSITLEPTTGIPIDVAARLQVNILLQSSDYIGIYKDLPKMYFPIFWFSEHVGITEEMASSLKLFLHLPAIGFYSSLGMVVSGSLMILAAGGLRYANKRKNSATNKKSQEAGGTIPSDQKTELVYLDTSSPNDDNQTRYNRQLYPKLGFDKLNL